MCKPIRLLIADNDVAFSRALTTFLDKQEDIKVVNVVRDGQGALNACKDSLPDVVLIDLHLPVLDSIKTIQFVVAQNEHIKILGISSIPDDRYAVAAIKVGAHGYIEKNGSDSYESIASAIRQVAVGEVVLNSTLASHILREFNK
jgi:DNA-binding NarL/FixJ family response regulator